MRSWDLLGKAIFGRYAGHLPILDSRSRRRPVRGRHGGGARPGLGTGQGGLGLAHDTSHGPLSRGPFLEVRFVKKTALSHGLAQPAGKPGRIARWRIQKPPHYRQRRSGGAILRRIAQKPPHQFSGRAHGHGSSAESPVGQGKHRPRILVEKGHAEGIACFGTRGEIHSKCAGGYPHQRHPVFQLSRNRRQDLGPRREGKPGHGRPRLPCLTNAFSKSFDLLEKLYDCIAYDGHGDPFWQTGRPPVNGAMPPGVCYLSFVPFPRPALQPGFGSWRYP